MAISVVKKVKKVVPAPAPAKVEVKQAVAVVSKQNSDGSVEEKTEQLGEPTQFSEPTANVGVTFGMTKNLGNFNNLKYSVSLHMPCIATAEEIENTYQEVKDWVDSKVAQIEQEITEQLGH